MSLDFDLVIPVGPPCETCGHANESRTVYGANVTGNLVPMWEKAGVADALYNSAGKRAGDIAPTLRLGLAAMLADPRGYKELNPSNGWGSYEHALSFLRETIAACEANPDSIVEVS